MRPKNFNFKFSSSRHRRHACIAGLRFLSIHSTRIEGRALYVTQVQRIGKSFGKVGLFTGVFFFFPSVRESEMLMDCKWAQRNIDYICPSAHAITLPVGWHESTVGRVHDFAFREGFNAYYIMLLELSPMRVRTCRNVHQASLSLRRFGALKFKNLTGSQKRVIWYPHAPTLDADNARLTVTHSKPIALRIVRLRI